MGLLVDGIWQDQWHDTGKTGRRFVRSESQFRNWVTPDGMTGPTAEGGFAAEVFFNTIGATSPLAGASAKDGSLDLVVQRQGLEWPVCAGEPPLIGPGTFGNRNAAP